MANLNSPQINITFTELGRSAITRGSRGVVGLIVRDGAEPAPLSLSQPGQVPTGLGLENQAYIRRAFIGYVNPPQRVVVYIVAEGQPLTAALDYMGTQAVDYLAGPADCTGEEAQAIAAWVKAQRAENGLKCKAVLPNCKADSAAVVNFTATGMNDGTKTYTTAEYCSRVAGLLAGTPLQMSATFAPLPELTDVARLTKGQLDEAVSRGELALRWDGRKVKLDRAVNSLTTLTDGVRDSFRKIKLAELMDMIRTDITAAAEDGYIGKYSNSYEDKLLLVTAVRNYFEDLRRDKLVKAGYEVDIDAGAQQRYLEAQGTDTAALSEQQLREAATGTHVFLRATCKLLDAIEDIDVNITI